jgi:hypothetical protein
MPSTTTITVPFGYNAGIPTTAAAWGARLIVTQDGMVDLVPDRQGFAEGDPAAKERLANHLRTEVDGAPFDQLKSMLRDRTVSTRDDVEHVLYDDGMCQVLGSAQNSAGYFYVAAYMTTDLAGFRFPAKSFDAHGNHTGPGPWLTLIHKANGIEKLFGAPDSTGPWPGGGYVEEYPDARVVSHLERVAVVAKTDRGQRVLSEAFDAI